ncbi:MAG: hypothetical protein ACRC2O_10640, partial [Chitinophagaceae bacterium]
MKINFLILFLLALIIFLLSFSIKKQYAPLPKLSAYGIFSGKLSDQLPARDVIPYILNTPLFSDYAEKLRFVKIPAGSKIAYNDSAVFAFPVGTILVKTFYFPNDFRNPAKGKQLIETRLLIHDEKEWKAYPYIWNEQQTEAYLDVAGDTKQIKYIDNQGKTRQQPYFIPNMNQCKGCHNISETMFPIGPSAKQL